MMTKEEFKTRWESNDAGGGIIYGEIAECAKAWGLYKTPSMAPIRRVTYAVLKAAGTTDAEDFNPDTFWGDKE